MNIPAPRQVLTSPKIGTPKPYSLYQPTVSPPLVHQKPLSCTKFSPQNQFLMNITRDPLFAPDQLEM